MSQSHPFHRIAPYVTNIDRDVFALRNLPEEVAAVLFAYYSRSPDTLRENLLKLLAEGDLEMAADAGASPPLAQAQEKARAFHEKWVVGYGHGSVAEHAVVKLAVENVSILASKLIEDSRLASYTEKSTRYVRFSPDKAHYPAAVMGSPAAGAYREIIAALMDAYAGWMEPVYKQVRERTPQTEKQTPRAYEAALRATTCDTLRYLLPAATHTNIGITINARALESMISKLLSQPLAEGREIGAQIKQEAMHVAPTLLKYADPSEYRTSACVRQPSASGKAPLRNEARIVGSYLAEGEALRLIAMPDDASRFDLARLMEGRGKHDPAPRCLERVSLTFELTLDYGAFRDVQRHRMATIITEPLSPTYGYETPSAITEYGYGGAYQELMEMASNAYGRLVEEGLTDEAAYVLPLAYRVRTHMTANLRELFHFIELRTGRGGHPSYRKIALQVFEEVQRVYPKVAAFIRPNKGVFALTRD
jgi:thymidylate synthase ThyX